MNRSGASVAPACQSLGIVPGDLIVVHDEIDLPFGTLRIKLGGGHGGHNGLRSITEALGHGNFVRMRLGVGRPPAGGMCRVTCSAGLRLPSGRGSPPTSTQPVPPWSFFCSVASRKR